MPLLFESLTHGKIPFGFFNTETDMVLLYDYFFFAGDMARNVIDLADSSPGEAVSQEWEIYIIDPGLIGNLMGAIIGFDLSGFIGEVYRRFPFPDKPDDFKQNPEGSEKRGIIEDILSRYGRPATIPVTTAPDGLKIKIGEYAFSREGFHELLRYLWVGGYPHWKDGVRPSFLVEMRKRKENSRHPLFSGLTFD